MRIDICYRQFNQDFQCMNTFGRIIYCFYQDFMQSLIHFVLWLNLNFLSFLIIFDKCRSVVDKCTLNRAANLLPRVLFVVELESYDKHDYFVNIHCDVP